MNKCIFTGRLAKDIELKQKTNPDGTITSYVLERLAVNREYKDANGNYIADFIPIILWNNNAVFCGKWCHKGDMVAVEGKLQMRQVQDKNGQNVLIYEVQVDHLEKLSSKNENQPQANAQQGYNNPNYGQPNNYQPRPTQPANNQQAYNQPQPNPNGYVNDNDVPF